MNIKNIIFDYGNVIFDIDHQLTIKAFTDLGASYFSDKFSHAGQDTLFNDFEKGIISASEFRNNINLILSSNHSDQVLDHAWNALLIGIPDGNLDLLKDLKTKYRTFLLSNNNIIHYTSIIEYLKNTFQIDSMDSYFEKTYYSHQMKMRKPDADIFERVLNENQLNPAETLFIDDSLQHIETAKKQGIQTHLLPIGYGLQKYFSENGLLNKV